jgi:hypothetical protein
MEDHEAKLNITYQGQNGDLVDPIEYDSTDAQVRAAAVEAINSGGVHGFDDVGAVTPYIFEDFVVDRFPSPAPGTPNNMFLRPKTPFG